MVPFKFLVLIIPTSILSITVALKLSAPIPDLTSIYNGLASWFRPPYLYLIINCIIATIFACSKLQSTGDEESRPNFKQMLIKGTLNDVDAQALEALTVVAEGQVDYYQGANSGAVSYSDTPKAYKVGFKSGPEMECYYDQLNESKEPFQLNACKRDFASVDDDIDASNKENNECVVSKSTSISQTQVTEYPYSTNVKSSVSSRFSHRKNLKSSLEGGKMLLGVSKPKRQDTLEATWKTITEGRPIPKTRHLKKLDTWEKHQQHGGQFRGLPSPQKAITKSDTFSDVVKVGMVGRMREPSLSKDELNRRVETFIRKFNEEMRLQRQQSLNQHLKWLSADSTSANC